MSGSQTRQRIGLDALSDAQRRRMEAHLPLVHVTIRRMGGTDKVWRARREAADLVQEGCVALAEALRSHDPARHGDFPAYAMARVHFAVSRYAHEHGGLIRVPFITQRRRRHPRGDPPEDRHDPGSPPRVVRLTESAAAVAGVPAQAPWEDGPEARGQGLTLGELVRNCYERALAEVVERLRTRGAGNHELVDRCLRERWIVPEPGQRTPIRSLARDLNCSLGRITHLEGRLRRGVAQRLLENPLYQRLVDLARQSAHGWRYRPSESELAELGNFIDDAH